RRQTIKSHHFMQPRKRAPSFDVSWDLVAMGEDVVHMKITPLHLWLEMLIILSTWPLIGHAQHTSLPEVAIPLKVTGNRTMGWLTYSLHFGGQRHYIYMKAKKLFISRHFSVFTYTDQDALHKDQPFVKKDCYYHGYMDGDPESMVALTTCFGGIQGTLQIKGTVYEIKPKNLSSTFEHLVYKIDSEKTQLLPRRCALTEEEIARQMKLQGKDNPALMQSSYEGWWTHKYFLDLALVVDHERILYLKGNLSHVLLELFLIVHVVNKVYLTLDVEIVLFGVELWNSGNKVHVNTIDKLLKDFCYWKWLTLNYRIQNDIAHLFVKYDFGIKNSISHVGSVCIQSHNCGVENLEGSELYYFGQLTAHGIGHNLGMKHDDNTCTCGHYACIMSQGIFGTDKFSNCSYAEFWQIIGTTNCMRKEKKSEDNVKLKFCGNGVVDDGEQCDCGSWQTCIADPCCVEGCKFKGGAACAFGLCCKDCQIMPSGAVCREKDNECDLPEWCDGQSNECPNDVYLLDGSSCQDGGYCYEKRCNNRDEQCRQIFGKEARSAAQTCYREINTQGDRFGNCGLFRGTYLRCSDSDILCGRLQCENVNTIPSLKEHFTVHWTQLNGVTCWGTDYHFGMTIADTGHVKDGTDCGPEHVCINRKCVNKSVWVSACSPEMCNRKGVCNNLHHCHCNSGWDPPFCVERGFGGSDDSGPSYKKVPKSKTTKWASTLSLLVIFPFVVLICLRKNYVMSPRSEEPSVSTSEEEEKCSE
ncbi:disintegrin and metalloproteinase domain-containing protein 25-like, partial [Sigmodon hispidus]